VTLLKLTQVKLEGVIASLEREVHHRQTIEQSLLDTQQSLAVSLDSIGAGFLATDSSGRVTRMNAVAEQLCGWAQAEAQGQVLWAVYRPESLRLDDSRQNPVDVMLRDALAPDSSPSVTLLSRQGGRSPVDVRTSVTRSADGAIRGLNLVLRDRSQQVLAAEKQAASDERFRRVVEAAPNGLLMVDRTQTIVMVNSMVEQIFGYDREELLGQAIELLIPLRFRAGHQAQTAAFQAGPNSRPMGRDLRGRRRDGSEVPVEIQLTPVEMVDGTFIVASIVDISARKLAETELRRSNAELEQFASVASHDLQEPLRMVASYTELLAKRYQGRLDEKADKYIFYANDGAHRMQQLVKDLLSYSRVGSQGRVLEPVSANEVAQRVAQMLHGSLSAANATLEIKPLPMVMADEGQLHQLFQNLIGNAVKFRSEQAPSITIEAVLEHDRWRFSVRDNGIGIEAQYSERIFQMFQRLHERGRYDGSGIGLAIVKRIVERHEGRVWFESTLGVGTTFYFTLMPARASSATS
jgi:PAS domain S-box-containing protein